MDFWSVAATAGATTATAGASAAATTVAATTTATAGATTTAAVATTTTAAAVATTTAAGATRAATATVATATATATAEATTAAGTTAATEATWALFARTCFIDDQSTTVHLLTVHAIDGRLSLGIRAHFDEAETLGATGFTIHHDLCRRHGAELREGLLQIIITYVVREVTNVEFVAHFERLSFQRTQNNCVASTYPDPFKQRRCYQPQSADY
jgi:hypothetical protein